MKSIVDQSHDFLKDVLHKGAICIDATLGWGKDTDFFLKNNVRKVYGFEIQQVVFEQTVSNIKDSHFVPVFDGHQNKKKWMRLSLTLAIVLALIHKLRQILKPALRLLKKLCIY